MSCGRRSSLRVATILLYLTGHGCVAFQHPHLPSTKHQLHQQGASAKDPSAHSLLWMSKEDQGWSVVDDWEALSSENPNNAVAESGDVYNQDIVANAARAMITMAVPGDHEPAVVSDEDMWLNEVIEDILQTPLSDIPLYDTGFTTPSSLNKESSTSPEHELKAFEEHMGNEIAMLVRCNESPQDMLVSAGRALKELTTENKNNASQLVQWTNMIDENGESREQWDPTPFFTKAIATIFRMHASREDGVEPTMDARAVSRWMSQSIGNDMDLYMTPGPRTGRDLVEMRTFSRPTPTTIKIGPHDSRVLKLLSKYSKYGSGKLALDDFQQLYLDALTRTNNGMIVTPKINGSDHAQILHLRNDDHVRQVWRDLRNHGILSPKEQEWNEQQRKLNNNLGQGLHHQQQTDFVDECEILELAYEPPPTAQQLQTGHDVKNHKYIRKSSYEQVQLAPDGKTPLYMNEGDFVFIDEESCIGCMQCVTSAPASFLMLENGRARTFEQRKGPDVQQGVAACPVNCMHFVSYDELKELETVRDKGDGRDDHRHMGHRRGHTPLHVAGMDSDNNHRSSWYHHIKNKCCSLGQCPQRGCFDCPSYSASGENPFFKKKAKETQHTRAQHFLQRGDADLWRTIADL